MSITTVVFTPGCLVGYMSITTVVFNPGCLVAI